MTVADARGVSLCPDFSSVLHGEEDVILAVDRHEFHHAVPETDIIFRYGEIANENILKDSADYAAYKEENEDALPKFKFRKLMADEFKNVLMSEIAPLID